MRTLYGIGSRNNVGCSGRNGSTVDYFGQRCKFLAKISIELHHSLTSFRTSAAVTGAAETVMMAVAVAVVAVAVGGGGGSGGGGHFFD